MQRALKTLLVLRDLHRAGLDSHGRRAGPRGAGASSRPAYDLWEIPEHRRGGAKEIVFLRLHVIVVIVALAVLALLALLAAASGGRFAAAVDVVAVVLFLTIAYRVLPRAEVSWRSCVLGALVTGAVLLAGEAAIAFYLARFHPESGYGEAGSTIVLLIWIYYSALLFLFGAILTRALENA
jgi:YihY family inner membrane protein